MKAKLHLALCRIFERHPERWKSIGAVYAEGRECDNQLFNHSSDNEVKECLRGLVNIGRVHKKEGTNGIPLYKSARQAPAPPEEWIGIPKCIDKSFLKEVRDRRRAIESKTTFSPM